MEEITKILSTIPAENIDKLLKLQQLFSGNNRGLLSKEISLLSLKNESIAYSEQYHSTKYTVSKKLAFNHLMKYFSPGRSIDSISKHDAEKFVMQLKQHVPEGFRIYFRNIRASFAQAVTWEYLEQNPFEKIKLPKRQKIKPAYLTVPELIKLLDKIKLQVVKDVVIVAFYSGMRLSEIVFLTADCIDEDKRLITIGTKEHNTKSKKQRTIPYGDEIAEVFARRKSNGNKNFFFAKSNGQPYTADFFSKQFKKYCREANLSEELHFHSLRHSFASNLVQNGISIFVVKELLGHASVSTSEIYSQCNLQNLKDGIQTLSKLKEGQS